MNFAREHLPKILFNMKFLRSKITLNSCSRIGLGICLLLLGTTLLPAQNYNYTVSTLLPENTGLFDDGICLDAAGNLYGSYWGVWQGAAGTHVGRFRTSGAMDTLAQGFNHPNGLNYANGLLYLANSGASQVIGIDTLGNTQVLASVASPSNVIPVPGDTDSLIAVSWQQRRLYGIRNGNVTVLASLGLLDGPVGLAFDPTGELYIGLFNNGNILHYEGNGQLGVIANIGGGSGFLTYSDGGLLATNHSNKRIYRINLADSSVAVIAGNGQAVMQDGVGTNAAFASPNGIVATPSGDTIYVTEYATKALRMIVRTPVATALEDKIAQDGLVYPVPASGMLRIASPWAEAVDTLLVYDLEGRLVQRLTNVQGEIDTTTWERGMYQLIGKGAGGELIFHTRIPKI